jgi:hypothetical protein
VSGARAIAKVIDRSEKATFYALEQGQIPGAKKVGGRWALDTEIFFASFAEATRQPVAA